MGRTKYYAICIESQETGSPHAHSYIWIYNAPNIKNEAGHIEVIEKTINAQLPEHLNDLELFELVKTYQAYTHSRTYGITTRINVASPMVIFLTEKTIIAKPLDSKFSNDEKQRDFDKEKYITKPS